MLTEKVFCIGVWKTATTSVGKACNYLIGGNHDGNNIESHSRQKTIKNIYHNLNISDDIKIKEIGSLIKDYSTFDDFPWNTSMFIEIMSREYSQYNYILTVRDADEWHYSAYSFYRKLTELKLINPFDIWLSYATEFRWILGNDIDITQIVKNDYSGMIKNKSLWIDWFHKRNEKVKSLFNKNLLVLDSSKGLHWEPICKFLNKEIPNDPFPMLNVNS